MANLQGIRYRDRTRSGFFFTFSRGGRRSAASGNGEKATRCIWRRGDYRLRVHRFTAGAQGKLDTVIERALVFSYVLKKKEGDAQMHQEIRSEKRYTAFGEG